LQTAATKDEALNLAIGAAETLMKALKLSSNVDEKKQLKAQCSVLMDVADRIKKSEYWTPLAKQQPENDKNVQIGQWAANMDVSASPGPAYQETASSQSSSMYSFSPTAAPANTRSASGNSPFSSVLFPSQHRFEPNFYQEDSRQAFIPFINLSDDDTPLLRASPRDTSQNAHADSQRQDSSHIRNGGAPNIDLPPKAGRQVPSPISPSMPQAQRSDATTAVAAQPASATSTAPKLASPSHIHRLTEPVSTRKRSRKEDIILLKASVVNGFKCPPWDKNPAPADFTPQNDQELFV
jgi:hypothetical protein